MKPERLHAIEAETKEPEVIDALTPLGRMVLNEINRKDDIYKDEPETVNTNQFKTGEW